MKLLCATDLNPKSDAAVDRACLLSDSLGARLTLVHVVAPLGAENGNLEQRMLSASSRLAMRAKHAGGKAEAVGIGETELRVAELIRPKLVADGMFLVGIDIVGDKILEVNVFSPGNLMSCSKLAGVDFSVPIIEAIERKVSIAEQNPGSFDNRHLAIL